MWLAGRAKLARPSIQGQEHQTGRLVCLSGFPHHNHRIKAILIDLVP